VRGDLVTDSLTPTYRSQLPSHLSPWDLASARLTDSGPESVDPLALFDEVAVEDLELQDILGEGRRL
jgi:hypothetical protein